MKYLQDNRDTYGKLYKLRNDFDIKLNYVFQSRLGVKTITEHAGNLITSKMLNGLRRPLFNVLMRMRGMFNS